MAEPSDSNAISDLGVGSGISRPDEVRFRDYRPGDEQQIVQVFRAGFGGFYASEKPVDGQDYIRWFTEPHQSHRGWVSVAEIGTRIVAFSGSIRREIRVGDRLLFGVAGGLGIATHPDFQGRGIRRALSGWREATAAPLLTASVERYRAMPRWRRHERMPSHGKMGVYLHVQHPWSAASARSDGITLLNALPSTLLAAWAQLRSVLRSGDAADVVISSAPVFDERFEPFLERASAAWDLIPVRRLEYLNWRFCDPRGGEFTVRVADGVGAPVGYSVLHQLGSRGHIVDLLALPGRLDVVRTLIRDAVRQFREAGTNSVECWMLREQPYARALRQEGFVRLPGKSADVDSEVALRGPGVRKGERALLASPEARIHLVRADFDGI